MTDNRVKQLCRCGHPRTIHVRKGKERNAGECVYFEREREKYCRCAEYRVAKNKGENVPHEKISRGSNIHRKNAGIIAARS